VSVLGNPALLVPRARVTGLCPLRTIAFSRGLCRRGSGRSSVAVWGVAAPPDGGAAVSQSEFNLLGAAEFSWGLCCHALLIRAQVYLPGFAGNWMLGWFQALMPREARFFDLFEKHAQTLVAGSRHLRAVLDGGPELSENCAHVSAEEEAADAITRDVIVAVRRTFITPFDRGDIQDLITSMDDAIDQMQQTTKAITMFEVTEFDASMRAIGDNIVKAAGVAVDLVHALREMRRDSVKISRLAEQMTRIEEESDQLHDQGVKSLFLRHRADNSMAFIVGSEIYGHLEKVMDRFEDVADRINGILIEHL
jgi:predicted phosphate transport protein (TIGR00153 family)